jgi:hypothetical protein
MTRLERVTTVLAHARESGLSDEETARLVISTPRRREPTPRRGIGVVTMADTFRGR